MLNKISIDRFDKARRVVLLLSISLYLTCLVFPAYYVKDTTESVHSFTLLIFGSLAIKNGVYSWLANPLYLLSLLFFKKSKVSALFAMISLMLALTIFFYHKSFILFDGHGFSPATSYGWGYYFWVLSIGIIAFWQLALSIVLENSQPISTIHVLSTILTPSLFFVLTTSFFIKHYYYYDGSVYNLEKMRDFEFNRLCLMVNENIPQVKPTPGGVYLEKNIQQRFHHIENNVPRSSGFGLTSPSILRGEGIEFYEIKNNNKKESQYLRYSLEHKDGLQTDVLESTYKVNIKNFIESVDPRLELIGYEYQLRHIKSNVLIASSGFVWSKKERRLCRPNTNVHYNTQEFIYSVLN